MAGQKGIGKWIAVLTLDLGILLSLIGESIFTCCLSAQKVMRVDASKVLCGPFVDKTIDKAHMISDLKDALLGIKIISYAQGYNLMMEAVKEYGWNLNYGGISLIWRGGCIIRPLFLADIKKAFDINPDLQNLLHAQRDYFGTHTYERFDKPRGEFSTPSGPEEVATPLQENMWFNSLLLTSPKRGGLKSRSP